jgi:hypothetical protein
VNNRQDNSDESCFASNRDISVMQIHLLDFLFFEEKKRKKKKIASRNNTHSQPTHHRHTSQTPQAHTQAADGHRPQEKGAQPKKERKNRRLEPQKIRAGGVAHW